MTDCLIVGFNDIDFEGYVNDVRLMGPDSGAYRDLRLAYIDVSPQPIIEVISFVRRHNPQVPIVVGGPFVTNQVAALTRPDLDALMEYLDADYYVIGREGELALSRLAIALRQGGDPARVPNL